MNYIKKSKKIKSEYFSLEKDIKEIKEIYELEDSIWILIKFENILELESRYIEVTDIVKVRVQEKLWKNKEKRELCWNTYIIFCTINQEKNIEKIKREIENNKYCCKKYVIQNKKDIFEIPYFMNLKFNSNKDDDIEEKYNKILSSSKEMEYIKNIIKKEENDENF